MAAGAGMEPRRLVFERLIKPIERVLAWPFDRVLVAHGEPLDVNAGGVFRRAFAAYL